jgi:hypothetical protein
LLAEVRHGVAWPWWMKFAGAVGSSTVVVPNVDCEHQTQVPLVEDQHAVGEFGSDSAHEPFGETVRLRASGRNPDHLEAHIGQDSIERRGELAGPIADEKPEFRDAIVEIHHQVADLLGSPSAISLS